MIMEVGPAGEVLEPKELRGRFHNAIGALVRDKLNPAIPNWKEVPENKKNELWDRQLKLHFRFPEGKHELVKKCFQDDGRVIPTLEVGAQHEYIQKGLTPFKEFGKITPSQWEELVAQKTSPEALELSARNTKLAKRNKHHHHLGPRWLLCQGRAV